jgi:peptidoglycan-associated lipoprotein
MVVWGSRMVVVVLALLLSAACAKRPAMTQTAAPPPTGAAVTVPPAPVAPVTPPPAPAPAPPPPVATAPPAPAPAPAPAPPRPAPAEFKSLEALKDVFFAFDRSVITAESARTLDAGAEWMKANPTALVLVEGHCDERGTNAYNLALGDRRARAAQEYLVKRGVPASRITTITYGEERPTCSELTESCWARNRRAHFLVKMP